jgi:hypothetical protein
MEETGFVRKSLFLLAGLLIWAAHFGVIYGFNGLACARRFAGVVVLGIGIVPLVVTAATLLGLAVTGGVLVAALRHDPSRASVSDAFLRQTTVAVAALSLVAIAWNGLPALIVPPCG